jgi:predicted nucleic acid-binding Zn ribbon protein
MPRYSFVCTECGKKETLFLSVEEYEKIRDSKTCECGGKMIRSYLAVWFFDKTGQFHNKEYKK